MMEGDAAHGETTETMVLIDVFEGFAVAREMEIPDMGDGCAIAAIEEVAFDFGCEFLAAGAREDEEDGGEMPPFVKTVQEGIHLVFERFDLVFSSDGSFDAPATRILDLLAIRIGGKSALPTLFQPLLIDVALVSLFLVLKNAEFSIGADHVMIQRDRAPLGANEPEGFLFETAEPFCEWFRIRESGR